MEKFKIKALLTGINNYPIPAHRLNGCLDDVEAMEKFLRKRYQRQEVDLELRILVDEQATRQNLIDTFVTFFEDFRDGDIGLFYFSGHGSQMQAPPEFRHVSPSGKLESIVCYDSRLEGGMDLLDKEIGYLISQINGDGRAHFLSVFDCCHSGTVTRSSDGTKVRATKVDARTRALDSFYGIDNYILQDDRISVPQGRHIQFSACKATEKAKEKYIFHKKRGVFTYSLIEALETAGGSLSYGLLSAQVRNKVRNKTYNQSPQLRCTHPEDNAKAFLDGHILPGRFDSILMYDVQESAWKITTGAGDRFFKSGDVLETVLLSPVLEDKQKIKLSIVAITPDVSIVEPLVALDTGQQYRIQFENPEIAYLHVAIDPGSDQNAGTLLSQAWKKVKGSFERIKLIDDFENAICQIKANQRTYTVFIADAAQWLFPPIKGYSEAHAIQVFGNINKWEHFQRIRTLRSDEESQIEDDCRLTLYCKDKDHDWRQFAMEDFLFQETVLHYSQDTKKPPAVRLSIQNTCDDHLFFSVLMLGADFSISNTLLEKAELEPGQTDWIKSRDHVSQTRTRDVPLPIHAGLLEHGRTSIDVYFKVLMSTQEFSTAGYTQKGILLHKSGASTKRHHASPTGFRAHDEKPVWASLDFSVRVHY